MKLLWNLFYTFAKIGLFTFGGGMAMLPMLQKEVVDKQHWATDEELLDYFAVGQCTPGIIAVNTATFVGYKEKGTVGGIVATLGVVFPSLVIITAIAAFLQSLSALVIVQHAFAGIRACVSALIVNAVISLWKKSVVDLPTMLIFSVVFILMIFTDLSPVIFVVLCGSLGILLKTLAERRKRK